ncbi:MAG: family 10 glycosylhydrolase [Myxococcaceae bacterium]|nr:family 10 glycosylhydrolase [Myxococcaceae bacterium]
MRPARIVVSVLAVVAAACSGLPAEELDSGLLPIDSGTPDSGQPPDDDAGTADSGTPHSDAGQPDSGAPDSGQPMPDGGGVFTFVPVSHPRELRAMWFATVTNLDFPRAQASSATLGPQALQALVTTVADAGFNAIFFQVRPESDALYTTTREPWSRFVDDVAPGTQGQNPGYDPLATLLTLAHARGVEVHAWVNPYRGLTTTTATAAPGHITNVLSQHAIAYNGAVTMDPSAPAVRTWVVDVIRDLATGFDIDGVVFDDYFYPYPGATPYPDDPQYQAYTTDGGTLSKSNWRRANVNALVRDVSEAITAAKPHVRFGIAPFGIYRPGMPAGVVGLDAYETLACDSLAWLQSGWVDYISPQLYWSSTSTGQNYATLIDWWAQQAAAANRWVIPSIAPYRLPMTAMNGEWTVAEFETEIALTRAKGPTAAGAAWFRHQHVRDNWSGIRTALETNLYAQRALPPPHATRKNAVLEPPTFSRAGSSVTMMHPTAAALRGYGVYRLDGTDYRFERLAASPVTLTSGTWALTAVDRTDVESPGVVVVVP